MKAPTARELAAELRKRAKTGRLRLERKDLTRVAAMLEKLAGRCYEAYQVVGALASDAGLFQDPAVERALDLLSVPERQGKILPFLTAKDLERTAVQSPQRTKTGLPPKPGPARSRKRLKK